MASKKANNSAFDCRFINPPISKKSFLDYSSKISVFETAKGFYLFLIKNVSRAD